MGFGPLFLMLGQESQILQSYLRRAKERSYINTKAPGVLKAQGAYSLKENVLGNDQLSQRASPQVPSALASLTTGFGMGPGVPLPLQSPRT